MTDRPILFSTPMVCALIEGRKTMTRRVLKLPTKTHSGGPIYEHPAMGGWEATTFGGGNTFRLGADGQKIPVPEQIAIWHRTTGVCVVTPHQVGDRLWVRERWQTHRDFDHLAPRDIPAGSVIQYEATGPTFDAGLSGRMRPGVFLPRWASRLTLSLTAVKVERLQEISDADAIAEGIRRSRDGNSVTWLDYPEGSSAAGWSDPRLSYRSLWNFINGPTSWDANPWVVASTFKVIQHNIDRIAP